MISFDRAVHPHLRVFNGRKHAVRLIHEAMRLTGAADQSDGALAAIVGSANYCYVLTDMGYYPDTSREMAMYVSFGVNANYKIVFNMYTTQPVAIRKVDKAEADAMVEQDRSSNVLSATTTIPATHSGTGVYDVTPVRPVYEDSPSGIGESPYGVVLPIAPAQSSPFGFSSPHSWQASARPASRGRGGFIGNRG